MLGTELLLLAVHKKFNCAQFYVDPGTSTWAQARQRRGELEHIHGPGSCKRDGCLGSIYTSDPNATRFHILCGDKLAEHAIRVTRSNMGKTKGGRKAPSALFIRPSSQWFRLLQNRKHGVEMEDGDFHFPDAAAPACPVVEAHLHHVCYAMHSSRSAPKP
mmetsp:Transcript_53191/g.168911  ORF Transcript_53191/g.168911 Transcript_53191/m.168911 type:complete len:160 (-) Transcript_53191:28-507(-)